MTNNGTAKRDLLAEVLDLQDRLVLRGALAVREHEVAFGKLCKDGMTLIECTCGRGMYLRDEESEQAYVLHVAEKLGLAVAA